MRKIIGLILVSFVCINWDIDAIDTEKPHVSFSFDDGNSNDILSYKVDEWNQMIVDHLRKNNVKAVWFIAGKGINNKKGEQLLSKWNDDGHIIANHTYNHLNYNKSQITCISYIKEIQKCDSLISGYSNYQKIFRFPYLKAGNTIIKRDSLRVYLKENGYSQGWVTIDASDWYVNSRLIQRLKQDPKADIEGFKEFYINHILDRAQYYQKI